VGGYVGRMAAARPGGAKSIESECMYGGDAPSRRSRSCTEAFGVCDRTWWCEKSGRRNLQTDSVVSESFERKTSDLQADQAAPRETLAESLQSLGSSSARRGAEVAKLGTEKLTSALLLDPGMLHLHVVYRFALRCGPMRVARLGSWVLGEGR